MPGHIHLQKDQKASIDYFFPWLTAMMIWFHLLQELTCLPTPPETHVFSTGFLRVLKHVFFSETLFFLID